MNTHSLRTGDLIIRRKGVVTTHYIVWIGWQNGEEIVAENQIGIGVQYTTLNATLAGNSILRIEKFGGSEIQRHLVIPKINELLGKTYDLVVFNCEHFARWIANGEKDSKQVRNASNIFLLTGGVMLASKSKAIRQIGILLIGIGCIGHLSQLLLSK